MKSGIPKRIIQIWGGGSDLPLLARAASANVRLLNPEFEYFRFDDNSMEDFLKECFPEYRVVFQSFRFPIQRYDFVRYLAIYQFGGFYFDMDVFLASSLSDLPESGCIFPFEALTMNRFLRREYGMDWEIGNYAFGATAGHPFLRAVIENCVRAQNDMKWAQEMMRSIPRLFHEDFFVLYTTGPLLVSRTLAEYSNAAKDVRVLFPENVCDPRSWSCFGKYGIHLMDGGWRKRKGLVRKQLYSAWKAWNERVALNEGMKLGEKRSLEFRRRA